MTPEEARAEFAKDLGSLMNATGTLQGDLATALGVKQTTISTWVRGKSMPEPPTLRRLARHFNVDDAAWLVLKLATMDGAQPRGRKAKDADPDRSLEIQGLTGRIRDLPAKDYEDIVKLIDKELAKRKR